MCLPMSNNGFKVELQYFIGCTIVWKYNFLNWAHERLAAWWIMQKNVMWFFIYIREITDFEKTTSKYLFLVELQCTELVCQNYLFCKVCSFILTIGKWVHLVHVSTLKKIKRSRNCTLEWNEKMLSAAKQRRRADLPRRMRERELARDQRNESALAEKGAEGMFLYFFLCKGMTYGWVEKCTTLGNCCGSLKLWDLDWSS